MVPAYLLPETVAHQDGMGPVVELDSSSPAWLLTLRISRILEQECLEVTLSGSPDQQHWLPLVKFPRKYYCGTYSHWLDLAQHPGVNYVRVEWKMTRWGPAGNGTLSAFGVTGQPVRALVAGAV